MKERLLYLEDPVIPTHEFMAMIAEIDRDELDVADIVAEYTLSAEDQTTVEELVFSRKGKGVGRDLEQLHEYLLLASTDLVSVVHGAYRDVARFCARFDLS